MRRVVGGDGHDFLAGWARLAPDRLAVDDVGRGRTLSYGQLDERAARLGVALREGLGLAAGARVATLTEGRAEVFEALFACAKAGLTLVPLNTRQPLAKLRAIVESAAPSVLLYDDGFPAAHPLRDDVECGVALGALRARGEDAGYESLLGRATPRALRPITLEDAPLVLYTSGTTAAPKGVRITWRQIVFNAISTSLAAGLTKNDRALACLPLFHTGGLHCVATPMLHRGGSIVLTPSFDPEREASLLRRGDVSVTIAVPTMYESLWQAGLREPQPHLRALLCGGAPLSRELHERFHDASLPMRQGYGLTEVGPNCFTLSPLEGPHRFGSVGIPTFHLEARLVRDDGSECEAHEPGELWLRGPHVTAGYWNAPELTEEVLDREGFFHTGDVLVRDEQGFFAVVDRKKDMFISGGENVYPASVAAALVRHPALAEVAVIAVPDARWGEVGLAAFTLRAAAERPSDDALRTWSRSHLAGYEVPRHWRALDEMPRTSTGKVDRAALREMVHDFVHGASAREGGDS